MVRIARWKTWGDPWSCCVAISGDSSAMEGSVDATPPGGRNGRRTATRRAIRGREPPRLGCLSYPMMEQRELRSLIQVEREMARRCARRVDVSRRHIGEAKVLCRLSR